METRANYVVVGLFTVLAVVAAFLFVYWTAGVGDKSDMVMLRFRIPGSASGLSRGSFVLFNGVRVGDVQNVYIDTTNPSAAIADAMVNRTTPVTRSTEAVIGLAGLTGTANIEMRGGNLQEPNLFAEAEKNHKVAEVTASPSAVTNLLQTAQDILTRANTVVADLEQFTKESRQPLTQTAENVRQFTDALAKNSGGIDKFLSSATDLADEISGLSAKLDGTLKAAEGIVKAVDQTKITSIVNNAELFSKNASDASKRFESVVGKVDGVVAKVDDLLGSGNTQTLVTEVGSTLKAYRQIAETLNTRLGPITASFSETLAAYRQVATTLNARIGPITDGLARFSGQGLRDAQALINDARRSVNRIEEAVSDLERNPQRIITGGEGEVRRFDGRARR